MFGKRFTLFELLGFKIQMDPSWIFLALLVTWSLAQGFFPALHEGLSAAVYWRMGIAGMIGLFVSLVLHELAHSVVARHYGLPIKGITLFIFGGVAEMEEEPASPKVEFLMAIAGPIASFALALAFYGISLAGAGLGLATPVLGVASYLSVINGLLAVFNLVPAFPLDGGRAFRAALWYWKDDFRWATRIAARSGEVFGLFMIALGVLNILAGNFIGGMWWFLIGMFLRAAASASYYQVLTRRAFEGEQVRRFMSVDPLSVPPGLSIRDLVEDYIYRYHYDLFPVTEDGRLVGCIGARQVKAVPREEWERTAVRTVLEPPTPLNTIGPGADPVKALSVMRQGANSRLMVVEDGRLVGILALKDLLEFLALKIDLEGTG